MSEVKFTPGPWEVDVCGSNIYIRQEGKAAFPIAYGGRMHHEKEAEKNAHLIASAPEMYEALQWCIYELERHNGNFDSQMDETMDFDKEIEKVRKALSKAEGK